MQNALPYGKIKTGQSFRKNPAGIRHIQFGDWLCRMLCFALSQVHSKLRSASGLFVQRFFNRFKSSIFSCHASITPTSSTSSMVSLSLMLVPCNVKFIREKRSYPSKLQDTLSPVHDCNLILAHKFFATLSSEEFILVGFSCIESC